MSGAAIFADATSSARDKMKAGPTALVLAALVLSMVAVIAATLAVVEAEKSVRAPRRAAMAAVYGRSFAALPHAPLRPAPALFERTAAAAPKIGLSQVAGASFSRPLGGA